jgi:hypothetical protein
METKEHSCCGRQCERLPRRPVAPGGYVWACSTFPQRASDQSSIIALPRAGFVTQDPLSFCVMA